MAPPATTGSPSRRSPNNRSPSQLRRRRGRNGSGRASPEAGGYCALGSVGSRRTASLKVSGMTCQQCADTVTLAAARHADRAQTLWHELMFALGGRHRDVCVAELDRPAVSSR